MPAIVHITPNAIMAMQTFITNRRPTPIPDNRPTNPPSKPSTLPPMPPTSPADGSLHHSPAAPVEISDKVSGVNQIVPWPGTTTLTTSLLGNSPGSLTNGNDMSRQSLAPSILAIGPLLPSVRVKNCPPPGKWLHISRKAN